MARFGMALISGHLQAMEGQHGPWVKVTGRELDQPVYVRLGQDDAGRLVCTGLVIGNIDDRRPDQEITARSLRIPLAAIVSEIARFRDGSDPDAYGSIARAVRAFIRDELRETSSNVRPRARPGAQGHPDEFYEDVAHRYRQAVEEQPRSPTKALAAQFPNYEEATVRYWLRVCRQRGLLGRSAPGRAGEARG